MVNESEFLTDKSVDRDHLEVEITNLPEIFSKWAFRAANAKSEMKQAEDYSNLTQCQLKDEYELASAEFERVQAVISQEVRKDPSAFKLEKVTEGSIAEVVKLDQRFITAQNLYIMAKNWLSSTRYQEAQKKLREAEANFNLLDEAKETISTKRSSLKYLADLWVAGYWRSQTDSPATESALHAAQRNGLKKPEPPTGDIITEGSV